MGQRQGGMYLWVLGAIGAGVLVGHLAPGLGVQFKPLGDGFLRLIKMLIDAGSHPRVHRHDPGGGAGLATRDRPLS
jgi:hypothetical protein